MHGALYALPARPVGSSVWRQRIIKYVRAEAAAFAWSMRVRQGLARTMADVRAVGGGIWVAARYEPASDACRCHPRRHPDVARRLFSAGCTSRLGLRSV